MHKKKIFSNAVPHKNAWHIVIFIHEIDDFKKLSSLVCLQLTIQYVSKRERVTNFKQPQTCAIVYYQNIIYLEMQVPNRRSA